MRMNEYTSIDLPKASLIAQTESLTPKFIEKLLLILIAFLGIIGSLYVFSASSNGNNSPNYQNLSIVAAASIDNDFEMLDGKIKFKHFMKIKGKKRVGQILDFTFTGDRTNTRYVLDMGNGERVIITANEFTYKYAEPGKYLLELKTIKRGLISTIATKELKIKG